MIKMKSAKSFNIPVSAQDESRWLQYLLHGQTTSETPQPNALKHTEFSGR